MIVAAPDTRCLRQQEGVGPPRKQLPRKKIPADLRSLARGHTELSITSLAGIAQNGDNERRASGRRAPYWIVGGASRRRRTPARTAKARSAS